MLTLLLLAQLTGSPAPVASACGTAIAQGPSVFTTEVCDAEELQKAGFAAPQDSRDRITHLEGAAAKYERAANLTGDTVLKKQILEQWSRLLEPPALNRPEALEPVLRELMALDPADQTPAFRLARALETRGLIDSAEDTLINVRRRWPDSLEPYRKLAQFYARRATALQPSPRAQQASAKESAGERDEHGIFRVGGTLPAPHRLDLPEYPPEAQGAGVAGAVMVEIVVDASGLVTDAKVVRSVPLLDAAALETVRNWRYKPTIVGGQAVAVRMTTTVNFSLR